MNLVAVNLGTLLCGHTLSAVLFGIFTVQTYIYAKNFAPLNTWTKGVIGIIWVLEIIYVGTVTAALFELAIPPLAGTRELAAPPPATVFVSAYILTMICLLVKGWLICKLGRMSLNRPMVIVSTIFGVAGAILAFVLISIMSSHISDLQESFPKYKWLIVAWLGVDIGFNAIVTASQLYFLWCRRLAGFAFTVTVLDKAMIWTTQSGVITSALYIVILICFFAAEDSWLWAALASLLPGVYVNAMLALLNGRKALSQMIADAAQEARMTRGPNQPSIAIEMSRTVYEVTSDPECTSTTSKYETLGEEEKGMIARSGGMCPLRKVLPAAAFPPFEDSAVMKGGLPKSHQEFELRSPHRHNHHPHPGDMTADMDAFDGGKCPMATAFSFSKPN